MNDYTHYSLTERLALWLQNTEFIIYVVTCVVLLFYQIPAYWRFRTRALMLLVISCGLTLFVTVFDHSIGQHGPPDPTDWWQYYLCREIGWIAAGVIGTVGSLMFLRDYVTLASAARGQQSSEPPPAPQNLE